MRPTTSFSLFLAFCATYFAQGSFATTYLGVREFGDPVAGAGSRSVAMGSTGLSRGRDAAVIRLNPALGGDLPGRELSLSVGPVFLTEKVVETSSSTKFRDSDSWQVNEFTAAIPFSEGRSWIGLAVAPSYDFNYGASFTQFSSTGSPLSQVRANDSGSLWALSPVIGVSLSKKFSLGLSYDFWMGNEEISFYQFRYGSGFTADFREKATYAGGAVRLGARWKATDGLSFGFVYQPSAKLTRDYDFFNSTDTTQNRSGKDKWDMPDHWGVGLSYLVEGDRETEMTAEVRQTGWGSLKINGKPVDTLAATKPIMETASGNAPSVFGVASATPRNYRDVTEVLVGVEHELSEQWRIRFGFHHLPYFADRTLEGTFFSAGAGYSPASNRWGVSFAGEFGKRDFKGDNLFYPVTQRVDETFRRVLVSGQWKW